MAVKYQKVETVDLGQTNTRFRRNSGEKWEYGWFIKKEEDGSVSLSAERTGATRTIFAEQVEFHTKGPRGGVLWVSATDINQPEEQ